MSINLYKKKTINNQPVLEELLSKSTDTVDNKPLVYDSTTDNVKSVDDLTVNSVTASCFHGPLDGTAKNATCFNGKTYAEACADILSGCAADSNKLNGKTYSEVCADILSGTAANAICFAGKTCTEWKDIIKTTCVDNAVLATNATCFNGCTYAEACADIRNGLATQTCVDAVQACADAVQNCADFIQSCVSAIESKIPAQASASNQLADKAFVNSSITTNTANFRGTYSCVADLPSTGNTNNDYAFVCSLNTTTGNYIYDRYKWVASSSSWVCEYEINTTGFTAEQLASINSGITSNLVAKITDVYDNTVTVCMNGECKGSFNLNQNTDVCIDLGSSIRNACCANYATNAAQASAATNATCFNGCTYSEAKEDFRNGMAAAVSIGNSCPYQADGNRVVHIPAYPPDLSSCAGLNCVGTVTQVKVGTTAYNPSSGVVSLPEYPTIPTTIQNATCFNGCTYACAKADFRNYTPALATCATCVARCTATTGTCYLALFNANTASAGTNLYVSCSKQVTFCPATGCLTTCYVRGISGLIAGNPIGCTSSVLGQSGTNISSGTLNLYTTSPSIGFHVNDSASTSQSLIAECGHLGICVTNGTGCTAATQISLFYFYSDGTLTATRFCGTATNSTCFNGCTYAQACTNIRSGLISDIDVKVYCGTTCKCTLAKASSLCLSANAFNANATISTTTYPGACCTGTSNYVVTTMVCCARAIRRNQATTGTCHLAMFAETSDVSNANVYVSAACPLKYNPATGVLNVQKVCQCVDSYHTQISSPDGSTKYITLKLGNANGYAEFTSNVDIDVFNNHVHANVKVSSGVVTINEISRTVDYGIRQYLLGDYDSTNHTITIYFRFSGYREANIVSSTPIVEASVSSTAPTGTFTDIPWADRTNYVGLASANAEYPLVFSTCCATPASSFKTLYNDTANNLMYNPSTNTLTTTCVCGSCCIISGNPTTCTSTQSGAAGSMMGPGRVELYGINPYIDFHANYYCGDYSQRIAAGNCCLVITATNATGCTASTQTAYFDFRSDGTFSGACTAIAQITCTMCVNGYNAGKNNHADLKFQATCCDATTRCNWNMCLCGFDGKLYNPQGFCGNLCGSAQKVCRNAITSNASCHLALLAGNNGADGTCIYVSSACPLTYNPATGVLTAKCFNGQVSLSTTSDFTCINCYTDDSDYDMAIVYGGSQPLGNVGVAEGRFRLKFNPSTGQLVLQDTYNTCCNDIIMSPVYNDDYAIITRGGAQFGYDVLGYCENEISCSDCNTWAIYCNGAAQFNRKNDVPTGISTCGCILSEGYIFKTSSTPSGCCAVMCGDNTNVGIYFYCAGATRNVLKVDSSGNTSLGYCSCALNGLSTAIGYLSYSNLGGLAIGQRACTNAGISIGDCACSSFCGIAIGCRASAGPSHSLALGNFTYSFETCFSSVASIIRMAPSYKLGSIYICCYDKQCDIFNMLHCFITKNLGSFDSITSCCIPIGIIQDMIYRASASSTIACYDVTDRLLDYVVCSSTCCYFTIRGKYNIYKGCTSTNVSGWGVNAMTVIL